jgi:small subunit ribosomal protein S10
MASGPSAVIKLVSVNPKDIDAIATQIKSIATSINVKSRGPVPLPTHILSQTTRKTPCGDGSHTYERWEMRIHKRLIIIEGSEQALRQIMRIRVPDTVQIEISLAG